MHRREFHKSPGAIHAKCKFIILLKYHHRRKQDVIPRDQTVGRLGGDTGSEEQFGGCLTLPDRRDSDPAFRIDCLPSIAGISATESPALPGDLLGFGCLSNIPEALLLCIPGNCFDLAENSAKKTMTAQVWAWRNVPVSAIIFFTRKSTSIGRHRSYNPQPCVGTVGSQEGPP